MGKESNETINNIQMLRAIAALLVIMHHALPQYQAMGGEISIIYFISEWGFTGVDIFFVISGFIMAYTTFHRDRNYINAKSFFKHRLFRIFFGYWPFFFIMLLALYITNPAKLENLDIVGSFFLINADMFQLILPVSWSLSYELYFYLLFLFTFLFSAKQLSIVIPVFTTFILLIVLYRSSIPNSGENFFVSPFVLEFFAGVLLYMYRNYLVKLWMLPVALILALSAYAFGIFYEAQYGLLRVVAFGSGAFFVVLTALTLERTNLYRAGNLFISLGNASYTLYLSHIIIIQAFYFVGIRALFDSQGTLLPLLGFFTIILLCIIFSLLYYKIIERPIYQKSIGRS